jgi:hypothetical protein
MNGGALALTFDVTRVGEVRSVTLAGIAAVQVAKTAGGVTLLSQGAPSPGPAEIVVSGATGELHGTLVVDDAPKGVPRTWIAFGASLTSGTSGMGIDATSQLDGPAMQAARAAGVFLPEPLLAELVPPLAPSAFDPTTCEQKAGTGPDAGNLLGALNDPTTGAIDARRARLDPRVPIRNVAVPGAHVAEFLRGAVGPERILEHLFNPEDSDPDVLFQPIHVPQIARIEQLDADVGLTTDLLANDIDPAVVASDDLHPELITPVDSLKVDLAEVAARLGKLRGHYFIANLPRITLLPGVAAVFAKRLAAGTDTQATFDAKKAVIDGQITAYNQALLDAVAPYPNLHVVDLAAEIEKDQAGITVSGEAITGARFGGFFSLDFLHLSPTGYGLVANVFLASIEQVLGVSVPRVDLAAVHARDPYSPTALRAAGLGCVP